MSNRKCWERKWHETTSPEWKVHGTEASYAGIGVVSSIKFLLEFQRPGDRENEVGCLLAASQRKCASAPVRQSTTICFHLISNNVVILVFEVRRAKARYGKVLLRGKHWERVKIIWTVIFSHFIGQLWLYNLLYLYCENIFFPVFLQHIKI